MKVSWIKAESDDKNFKFAERLGMDVYRLSSLDDTDRKLDELVKQNYNTIILSNEVAGFSQDIITKYSGKKDVNIIISPR